MTDDAVPRKTNDSSVGSSPADDAVAPKNSPAYMAVRGAAERAGVAPAFRDMCMLLKAPASLDSLILVVRNIRYMLTVLTGDLALSADRFSDWTVMTDWVWDNQDAIVVLGGDAVALKPPPKNKSVAKLIPHPMQGFGLTRYPIYSAVCNNAKSDDHIANYARLQVQLLVARRGELAKEKSSNPRPYIDLYEAYSGDGDFAKNVRQPDAAARAVRGLSGRPDDRVLAAANGTPESFVKVLKKLSEDSPHLTPSRQWLDNLRHYCGLLTKPHEGWTHGGGSGGGYGVYGYVEYNSCRFGVEFTRADEDDEGEESSQEAIFETPGAPTVTDDSDAPPGESVHTPALMLQDGPKNGGGNKPGRSASARTNVAALEIDKDHLQWSAIHLRSGELVKSLLTPLAIVGEGLIIWDLEELETCALIAVCLETGRPLQEAMKIVSGNADTTNNLAFIPSKNPLNPSRWSWRALEPAYAKKRPMVKELEVERAAHVRNDVHHVANNLLREWRKHQSNRELPLFLDDQKIYQQRIRKWLGKHDTTKRLTISKISRLKWSLLSQECGGDIATVSLVLGLPHPLAHVSLYYSLLSVTEATYLFDRTTRSLWGKCETQPRRSRW